jgi:hypothetical protein
MSYAIVHMNHRKMIVIHVNTFFTCTYQYCVFYDKYGYNMHIVYDYCKIPLYILISMLGIKLVCRGQIFWVDITLIK